MQELLTGKKRLEGFSGEWVEVKLGDIANIKTGDKNNEDKIEDGKYPFYVRSKHVERINTFSYDCESIIVPGEGNIGEIFHYVNGKYDLHQRVYGIRSFIDSIYVKYVYYYMAQFFGSYALVNTVKATVDSLRLPTFQKFVIKLPESKEEQRAIATILSDMDSEIEKLQSELLTGRIRLLEGA